IPIRRSIHDGLGADIAAGSRPVLDDELLAESLGQPLADQTRSDVGPAARRKADDNAHRPRRIRLRPRDPWQHRRRGTASDEMQKSSPGKIHRVLSRMHWRPRAVALATNGLSNWKCSPAAGTNAATEINEDSARPRWQLDEQATSINDPTGRKRNDDPHRPRRVGLRPRNMRQDRQRGSRRGHMQKSTTRMDHLAASPFRESCPSANHEPFFDNIDPVRTLNHSGFIPENLTTLPHLSVSSAMRFPKSAGVPGSM